MPKQDLKAILKNLHSLKNPFVFFRLPDTQTIQCYYQKDDTPYLTEDLKCKGFVWSPFEKKKKETLFIPDTYQYEFDQNTTSPALEKNSSFNLEENKSAFLSLIEKAKHAIQTKGLKKIVLSRSVRVNEEVNLSQTFINLLHTYPHAFVYLWNHPKTGTWFGATPEQLISQKNETLETMALAGTKPFKGTIDVSWDVKEKEEQQLVSDQIFDNLSHFFFKKNISFSQPFTRKAGNLLHLCTTFTTPATESIASLVNTLHPTPAVGGSPKKEAVNFIKENEGYERAYYTGFLGPINNHESRLFVNLRCAQYQSHFTTLFVGAGITSKSKAENEWEETRQKTKTILTILNTRNV